MLNKKHLTEQEFIVHVRDLAAKKQGQKVLATAIKISEAFLSDVLNRRRPVSAEFADKLGFEKRVYFARKAKAKS